MTGPAAGADAPPDIPDELVTAVVRALGWPETPSAAYKMSGVLRCTDDQLIETYRQMAEAIIARVRPLIEAEAATEIARLRAEASQVRLQHHRELRATYREMSEVRADERARIADLYATEQARQWPEPTDPDQMQGYRDRLEGYRVGLWRAERLARLAAGAPVLSADEADEVIDRIARGEQP